MDNFFEKLFMPPKQDAERTPESEPGEPTVENGVELEPSPGTGEGEPTVENGVELEPSPETQQRERERREALEKEVREMTITPELEERAAEDKKEIAGLDKEGEENRFRNLIEKDGYLYAIKVVMDSGNADALDRLHSFLSNPNNADLLEKK